MSSSDPGQPAKPLVAQPYIRTSTDDKGQNPERQRSIIRKWAEVNDVTLLEAVVDEGSSASKVDAFERPLFVEACQRAERAGADAVVLEEPDRLTRMDGDVFGWTKHEVGRRYGLRVLFAAFPLELQEQMLGRLLAGVKAEMGHEWVQQHSARVKSGMAQAEAEGGHMGRPRKELSERELRRVRELRAEGVGWGRCAHEVSDMRGAFDMADPDARAKRLVSRRTVQRRFEEWSNKEASTGEPGQKSDPDKSREGI